LDEEYRKAVEALRDSAPKNQHDKKKLPEQIIVPASKPERSTDHKLAKANGTNRTRMLGVVS